MVFGLSLHTFTILHVIITLIAVVSGVVVVVGMLGARRLRGWTALYLVTIILTNVTGFMFPISGFTPGLGVGVVSLVLLALALYALYARHLSGHWRWVFVATAVAALYLDVFVLIVQLFGKVPSLHALAPTGSEPPFVVTQTAALAIFLVLGIAAAMRFRPVAAI